MITDTLSKPKNISVPHKETKWRNRVFTKNGVAHWGVMIWASEEEARAAIERIEKWMEQSAPQGTEWGIPVQGGITIRQSEYSWAIQIPILEN